MKKLIFAGVVFGLVNLVSNSIRAIDLGDPAPKLEIADWVKGTKFALEDGKGKTVYVVEFWATWCGPCKTSIPHLTDLQKKYKDSNVRFIGISDEKVDVVKKFVDQMGDKMDYTVATDQNRKTSTAYMRAFGVNGIPHAFIVDKAGKIVWHGHPMAELDQTIEKVLKGNYDIQKAKKLAEAHKLIQEYYQLASEEGDDAKLEELGKKIEKLDKELEGLANGKPLVVSDLKKQARFSKAANEYQRAVFEGQSQDKIDDLAAKLSKVAPPDFKLDEMTSSIKFQAYFRDYFKAATTTGENLDSIAKKLTDAKCKNSMLLNQASWTILTDERFKTRDLKLALAFAKDAFDACEGKEAAIVDTYARALFDNNKVKEAVEFQKKALELLKDGDNRQEMEAALKKYQEKL